MEYLLKTDFSWPAGHETIAIKDGIIVAPETLIDPEEIKFAAGHTMLTPGWTNSHAHLELSGCPPVAYNGSFADWIYEVLQFKLAQENEDLLVAYKSGSDQLLSSGVCRVVDHCDKVEVLLKAALDHPLDIYLCKELIAYSEEQRIKKKTEAQQFLSKASESGLNGGLAPHAPYSAHPEIYSMAARLTADLKKALSMHLHEIEAELEYALEGTGEFVKLLKMRGVEDFKSPFAGRPLPALVKENIVDRPAFGIHLNYLNETDYRWLQASNITPVFCPNSYSHFKHQTLPVLEWFARDIPFCLGTDSTCSNRGLDMLDELKTLHRLAPEIPTDQVLKALTVVPTRLLAIPERGVLATGTPADISVFELDSADPDLLAHGKARALTVINNGTITWTTQQ